MISLEMRIPIEQLKKWESELANKDEACHESMAEKTKKQGQVNKDTTSKLQTTREKYTKLFLGKTDSEKSTEEERHEKENENITEQDLEAIRLIIATVEKELQLSKDASGESLKKLSNNILKQLQEIERYREIPFDETYRLQTLIFSQEMQRISMAFKSFPQNIARPKRKISNAFIKNFWDRISEMSGETDIEKWKALERSLTSDIERGNISEIGAIKSKIHREIVKIQTQKGLEKVKAVPSSILKIVSDLANGQVDIKKAQETIQKEAKKRLESSPKSKFALSEEQQMQQVLMQIKTAIMERAKEFPIKKPEDAIKQIQELCGDGREQTINIVVTNLIGIKHFEDAKRICQQFFNGSKRTESINLGKRLRDKIKYAEISDMVLRVINDTKRPEVAEANFDKILEGIQRGNINLSAVYLGKSQDGKRTITLADVLGDEDRKTRKNR